MEWYGSYTPVHSAALVALGVAGFGVIHSLTAGEAFKRLLARLIGERLAEGWYRLLYNGLSVVTILPALGFMLILPQQMIYRVDGVGGLILVAIQFLALLALAATALSTDLIRFAGLRQLLAWAGGKSLPLPSEPFVSRGFYGLVRHPLYLFSIALLWATPTMSSNYLAFASAATLYFAIGSLVEEGRLLRFYGEQYRTYRSQVPWMLPLRAFRR